MSSPRGLDEGGIWAITCCPWLTRREPGRWFFAFEVAAARSGAEDGVGLSEAGRGRRERREYHVVGGRRTLRYMLSGRSVLFEWLMYLWSARRC